MRILKTLLALCFALSFISAQTVVAQEQSLLYYILDGSGSMWGRAEGRLKIQVAKEVLSSLVKKTPENIHGGLMVYGHRRKGDCKDIEEIIPLGALDKQAALAAIKGISPKGMTPISASISQAIAGIKGHEYATSIVLVSDGIETCNANPCAVTRELKASGVNFVMHVVGLGVKEKEAKQLQCIAEAGGGEYFSAENADQLLDALNKIQEAVVEKKELEVPTPVPTATPIVQDISSKTKSIRIKASGPGRLTVIHDDWLKKPNYWKLLSPETGEEKARYRDLNTQVVPPGDYQISWKQVQHGSSEVVLSEVVTIESGKTTEVPLRTAARPVVPQWVKTPKFWGLQEIGSNKSIAKFRELGPQLVPAGEYNIVWQQSEHGAKKVVLGQTLIAPDVINDLSLTTAINLVPAEWVSKKIRFWALSKKDGGGWLARFSSAFDPQLVPPGTYDVIYRLSEHGSTNSTLGEIEIKPNTMNEFLINTGVQLVAPADLKPPYQVHFVELNEKGKEVDKTRLSESFGPMPLKPGTYRIDYRQNQHGGGTVTLVESFELPAGHLVEIEL